KATRKPPSQVIRRPGKIALVPQDFGQHPDVIGRRRSSGLAGDLMRIQILARHQGRMTGKRGDMRAEVVRKENALFRYVVQMRTGAPKVAVAEEPVGSCRVQTDQNDVDRARHMTSYPIFC